jgi:hypothetical protein
MAAPDDVRAARLAALAVASPVSTENVSVDVTALASAAGESRCVENPITVAVAADAEVVPPNVVALQAGMTPVSGSAVLEDEPLDVIGSAVAATMTGAGSDPPPPPPQPARVVQPMSARPWAIRAAAKRPDDIRSIQSNHR